MKTFFINDENKITTFFVNFTIFIFLSFSLAFVFFLLLVKCNMFHVVKEVYIEGPRGLQGERGDRGEQGIPGRCQYRLVVGPKGDQGPPGASCCNDNCKCKNNK